MVDLPVGFTNEPNSLWYYYKGCSILYRYTGKYSLWFPLALAEHNRYKNSLQECKDWIDSIFHD